MDIKDLKTLITAVNNLISFLGCDKPEHQKNIQELQAAMQKVKDLVDGMEECQA